MRLAEVVITVLAVAACAAAPVAPPAATEPIATRAPSTQPPATREPAPTPTATPARTPTAQPTSDPRDPIVHEGDLVQMTGRIIGAEEQSFLCADLVWATSRPPSPGCGVSAMVTIRGLDPRSLPGSDDNTSSAWVTRTVTVTGEWQNGAIQVTNAVRSDPLPDPHEFRPIPCEPPQGGWSSQVGAVDIDRLIEAHPELYAGHWYVWRDESGADPPAASYTVAVIATVEELAAAEARLREGAEYNLCVVHVGVSNEQLAAMERELKAVRADQPVDLQLDLTRDGIVLNLAVLDEAAAEIIGTEIEGVTVQTYVRKVADGLLVD